LAIAAIVLVLIVFASPVSGNIEFNTKPLRVSKITEGDQVELDLAVGPDDHLVVVWQDGRLISSSSGYAIYFATSEADSRGTTFSAGVRVAARDDTVDRTRPAVAVGADGVVHVVWQERTRNAVTAGDGLWEVWYSGSVDDGLNWSEPVRVSPLNNRNNTNPDVAATAINGAYVAWELEENIGQSIALALVEGASVQWVRQDFVHATDAREVNAQVALATEPDGRLHVAYASQDLDGGGFVVESQICYVLAGHLQKDSVVASPVRVADDDRNWTNLGPSLALTSRHGAWVVWTRVPGTTSTDPAFSVMADRVVSAEGAIDLEVGSFPMAPMATPLVDASGGEGDDLFVSISGVGAPTGPPVFSRLCSEQGCFAEPMLVASRGTTVGHNTSLAVDSLGNVFVGWDDARDIWLIQRLNTPPGQPVLVRPMMATRSERPEFAWSFNDPDAGSSQGGFELLYSRDSDFSTFNTSGIRVGALGKASRYEPAVPMVEGIWYWKVRTMDQLGLWSEFSSRGEFILDHTPPAATIIIDRDNEFTGQRVVVLTINASDNMEEELHYELSNDPNFENKTGPKVYPPPNNQENWELSPGDGIKVVFLKVTDRAGLSIVAMDAITYNATPLVIAHTPVLQAAMDEPLNISCEILRVQDAKVVIYYREADESKYTERLMESNGSLHWYEIPDDDVTLDGVEYYLKAIYGPDDITSPPLNASEMPHSVEVFEAVEDYEPSIYSPVLALVGTIIIVSLLLSLWYFRLREKK
jgi:hypothetical protein